MASKSHNRRPKKRSSPNQTSSTSMAPPSSLGRSGLCTIVSCLFGFCVFAVLGISSYSWYSVGEDDRPVEVYSIRVVREFPHDPNAFTQGLLYGGNESLFESTGLNGKSSVRKVALWTGKAEALHEMDYSDFGEGLTLLGERLFQVIWLGKTGFIYDRYNLSKFERFTHEMDDGWGLATDGKVLFGSDGSSTLYQIDPQTFKVLGKHTVKFNGHEVHDLNELEFINGEVWANVWMTDCIARISPKDGIVLGWVLLQNLSYPLPFSSSSIVFIDDREGLLASGNKGIDALNGIAWDSDKKRLFVTGKLWPKLYEIELQPAMKQFDNGVVKELCLQERYYS